MKLLLSAALVALASATPAKRAQANIPVDVPLPASFPAVVDGATPFVSGAASKVKRATLIVDVWMDSDRAGRHEGLYTDSKFSV